MKTSIISLLFALALLGLSFRSTAGNGVINPNGTMDFSVNFRYPPTPADITRVRNALVAANLIICDATDGQLRFGTIRITAGAAGEDEADIWVYAEPGRSGVSFRFDGRSFGTLGAHVTLFQGGIDGGTIAHELGHLAFGLGDEYDEQCRWGGPCGIGPCFDAAGDNLMMQSGNQSELCVAGNHDPRQGNAACPTTVLCTGMGPCTDPNCALNWNSTTIRFELTQQSQIHPGLSCWETLDQNYTAQINPPVGLPTVAAPSGCGTPNIIQEVTGTEQIMLIIDRSGSMGAHVSADPASQTRMEFAKAAARAFVDLRAGSGARVGLVSFDDIPTLERNMIDLTFGDAPTMRTTIDNL
ncbi:MAG: VWA domain-containing protein, partial [Saprospiraceae bacterium]